MLHDDDHRALAHRLGLFHLQEEAAGSVFWHPRGLQLLRALEDHLRRIVLRQGYREVRSPQVLSQPVWERSGHWSVFRQGMLVVEGEARALKPVSCPGHMELVRRLGPLWGDLPLRLAEFGLVHRDEPSGALHGLFRLRQFSQDDGHIFCREDQVESETRDFLALLNRVYADLGVELDAVKLALRPEVRAGTDEMWDMTEAMLDRAARAVGLEFEVLPGEGGFYAPKLEFHLKDAIGRTWQCGTLQLDMVMPERLDATYIGEDGQKHRPIMLHRAIFGSLERFLGVLIEHYAGAFPLWLAPVQIVVATITSDANDYAQRVASRLRKAGLRVETDLRNEKVGYKVREHSLAKVPVIAVVGKREAEEGKVALRRLGSNAQTVVTLEEATAGLAEEATPPDLR